MCKAVKDRGYRIVSGGTDNHLFLVDVKTTKGISGKDAAAALDAAGIVVNKNTIPYDTESPFKTSGIRVGTASITTRGMKEKEAAKIGEWIADVLDTAKVTTEKTVVDGQEVVKTVATFDAKVQAKVKAKAKALTAKFLVP